MFLQREALHYELERLEAEGLVALVVEQLLGSGHSGNGFDHPYGLPVEGLDIIHFFPPQFFTFSPQKSLFPQTPLSFPPSQ